MQGTEQDHEDISYSAGNVGFGCETGMVLLIILCEQCAEYLPGQ